MSVRDIGTELSTHVQAPSLEPIFLYEAEFDSGTIRFFTGYGSLVYNSNTYLGAGKLIKISEYGESSQLQAQGMQFTLNGIDTAIISVAQNENYNFRPCSVYLGALDANGQVDGTAYKFFSGLMSSIQITNDGNKADLVLSAESRAIILKQKKERRYTPEDQKTELASDTFFDYLAGIQDEEIIWQSKA